MCVFSLRNPNNPMYTFEKWSRCHKTLNNEANILVLRRIVYASGAFGLLTGALALPALGFGLGGISAGSVAAWIQGPAVAAGSWFAVLQSLGATGLGIVLFGSLGTAVGVLAPLTTRLGWCDCDSKPESNSDADVNEDETPGGCDQAQAQTESNLNVDASEHDENAGDGDSEPPAYMEVEAE
jgi:hypothetical protein